MLCVHSYTPGPNHSGVTLRAPTFYVEYATMFMLILNASKHMAFEKIILRSVAVFNFLYLLKKKNLFIYLCIFGNCKEVYRAIS